MKLITFADGVMRLGGEALPGILSEMRISGKVRFDEQKVDGLSGKKKTPQGWEDADLSLSLYLPTDENSTCYEKAEALNSLFRKLDDAANPEIYTVASRHAQARGIRQVIFSRLDTSEDDRTDEIKANLCFVEHRPPIIRVEREQAKTLTPEQAASQGSTPNGGNKPEYEFGGEL